MIEHRKRQKLALLNEKTQLPILPKKSTIKRQGRIDTMLTASTGSLPPKSTSITHLRPNSIAGEIDINGNSDPLPRRKRSPASFPIPPPLPPPRPTMSHSKSLTNVSLNSHQICTEV